MADCCLVNRRHAELLIDADDVERVGDGWRASLFNLTGSGEYRYVVRGARMELLHRVVTQCPRGMVVDHINGNGLDNRRANLRVCTHAQNSLNTKLRSDNTTGYKGVLRTPDGRFEARIRVQCAPKRRIKSLGKFSSALEAHQAYCAAARAIQGEFARLPQQEVSP